MTVPRPVWAPDLDHEISQLLWLHREMQQKDYRTHYDERVRRAMDVAYASHFRALLEFFHDGRQRHKSARGRDLHYSDVTGSPTPFEWSGYALRRLQDADRLVGHLSQARRHQMSDWDNAEDWALVKPMIDRLLAELVAPADLLPAATSQLMAIEP